MKVKYKARFQRTGDFLLRTGRTVGKQVLKQAQLIRAQQIRDQKALNKQSKKVGRVKKQDWRDGFKIDMQEVDF